MSIVGLHLESDSRGSWSVEGPRRSLASDPREPVKNFESRAPQVGKRLRRRLARSRRREKSKKNRARNTEHEE